MPRPTPRDSHNDATMTQISIGYSNAQYVAADVFPVVTVAKQSDIFFIFPKASWFRRRAMPRAPGNRAKRVDYELTTASYTALPYALAHGVTDEEVRNADAPLTPFVTATEFVTDGLLLDMEIRVADLVTTCGNWANASNPSVKWDVDTSDPWADIDNLNEAISGQIGRNPTVAVMSSTVWKALRRHPDLVDRVKYTQKGGRMTSQMFAEWFGYDKVVIGNAIKNTALEGAADDISRVWGDAFWAGFVSPAPALRTPSAGYSFEWGTRKVERFPEDQEHQDVIAAEHHTTEQVTASDAGGGLFDVTG